MSKSILVIDKVDKCCQCPFSGLYGDYCAIKDNSIPKHIDKKANWCPLLDLPEKANHPDYCDNGRYDKGWNDCIDEILKGANGNE